MSGLQAALEGVNAIVGRDPVVIAIGSAGAAPVLVRKLRGQIQSLLPARLGALAPRKQAARRGGSRPSRS